MRPLSLSLCFLLLGVGCGSREAGPSESEEGYVFIWELTTATGTVTSCAAELELGDGLDEGWVGLYLAYRVEEGLETATGMVCETFDASSCVEDPAPVTYTIDGHRLSLNIAAPFDSYGGCEVGVEAETYVIDEGESGIWGVDIEYVLTGDSADCDTLDAAIADEDPDGHGLADCLATVGGELLLRDDDPPTDD
jgi:hypothetical protein